MSTTQARPSFKTLLQIADPSGTNFSTVAEVMDLKWGITTKTEDTTSHSNLVPWTTTLPVMMTFGPVEFTVNWVPTAASHNAIAGLTYIIQQMIERRWKVIDPQSLETYEFDAVITKIDRTAPVAGVKRGSVSLMGSGQPTIN